MYQISTWSTKYCKRTTEKVWRSNTKKNWFAECHLFDTRQTCSLSSASCQALGKVFPLPSVRGERANFFLKMFASASPPGTRQSGIFYLKKDAVRFRVYILKKHICRVSRSGTRQTGSPSALPSARSGHSAKKWFAECLPAGTRQTWTASGGRYLTLFFTER